MLTNNQIWKLKWYAVVIDEDEVAKDKLLKDKYPEVNALIERYREGLTSGDINILKEVYDSTESMSTDVVTSTSEIIESYSDTVCYTKRGLEDNSYFVFIYDNLKINGIDTETGVECQSRCSERKNPGVGSTDPCLKGVSAI